MMSRFVAPWAFAVALLAGACGAGDVATPSTEMGTTMPPITAVSQDAATRGPGGDQSAFCAALAELSEGTDADFDDPAVVEAELARGIELFDEVARLADPARASTYEQLAERYRTLYDLAEANDFDYHEALQDFNELGLFDELVELSEVSEQHDHEVCGAPAPLPSEDSYAPHLEDVDLFLETLDSPEGRALLIEEFLDGSDMTSEQAACLVDNLDVEALSASGPEDWSLAIALGEVFRTCDIDIDEFNG